MSSLITGICRGICPALFKSIITLPIQLEGSMFDRPDLVADRAQQLEQMKTIRALRETAGHRFEGI